MTPGSDDDKVDGEGSVGNDEDDGVTGDTDANAGNGGESDEGSDGEPAAGLPPGGSGRRTPRSNRSLAALGREDPEGEGEEARRRKEEEVAPSPLFGTRRAKVRSAKPRRKENNRWHH